MNADAIDKVREKTTNDNLKNEFIEVQLLKRKLNWRIDYRHLENWKKALVKWNEPFIMVDTRNGQILDDTWKPGEVIND